MHDGPRFAMPALTPAIKLLLLVNGAVFLANMLLFGRLSDSTGDSAGYWFAFSWSGLFDAYGLGLLRVLTYQFTHSFRDPLHLLWNMLMLYFFGTMAEQRLGYRGAIRLYLVGGAVGALLHLGIASLQGQADVPLVGASGACYSFLLYATFMAPRSTVVLVFIPVRLWALAALLVGLGVYSTFVEFATGYPGGVSHGAHLGGAVIGALAFRAGWFVDHRFDGGGGFVAGLVGRWRAARAVARRRSGEQEEERLDGILAKVKRSGIGSLSSSEKAFLDRVSANSRSRGS